MVTLFGKVALIAAMAIGTYFMGDSIGAPTGPSNPCTSKPGSSDCCYFQCTHNPDSGCHGSGRGCTGAGR